MALHEELAGIHQPPRPHYVGPPPSFAHNARHDATSTRKTTTFIHVISDSETRLQNDTMMAQVG